MKLAIMQPYFFPYIGYWQLINAVDRFVIYDDVNYIKKGWINRNRILINGAAAYLTAPLQHASPNKWICDSTFQPSFEWRSKLVKKIEMAYRRAPYFTDIFPVVEMLIRYDADKLSDFLVHQLQILSEFMGIKTKFILSSRCYGNSNLSGQSRVLDICAREGATIYVNPQGGQVLYDSAAFAYNNLTLKFLVPTAIEYNQFGTEHVPWLSIIDVMMFNSKRQLLTLMDSYELV